MRLKAKIVDNLVFPNLGEINVLCLTVLNFCQSRIVNLTQFRFVYKSAWHVSKFGAVQFSTNEGFGISCAAQDCEQSTRRNFHSLPRNLIPTVAVAGEPPWLQ